jgi:hypothetical protein
MLLVTKKKLKIALKKFLFILHNGKYLSQS